jgi:hypothetical protein
MLEQRAIQAAMFEGCGGPSSTTIILAVEQKFAELGGVLDPGALGTA